MKPKKNILKSRVYSGKGENLIMNLKVLDIETTGLNPMADSIVSIGIVNLNTKTFKITTVFNAIIHETNRKISPNTWIFQHSDLKYDDVMQKGVDIEQVRNELQFIFDRSFITAYNQQFDFSFFLARNFQIKYKAPDPMLILTDILKIEHDYYGLKWPKVQEALDYFEFDEVEKHLALEDAIQEAKIVRKLIELKKYPIAELEKFKFPHEKEKKKLIYKQQLLLR